VRAKNKGISLEMEHTASLDVLLIIVKMEELALSPQLETFANVQEVSMVTAVKKAVNQPRLQELAQMI